MRLDRDRLRFLAAAAVSYASPEPVQREGAAPVFGPGLPQPDCASAERRLGMGFSLRPCERDVCISGSGGGGSFAKQATLDRVGAIIDCADEIHEYALMLGPR